MNVFYTLRLYLTTINKPAIGSNYYKSTVNKNSKRILDPTSKFKSIQVFKYSSIQAFKSLSIEFTNWLPTVN